MKYGYLDTGKASDPAKSAPLISSDGLKSYIEEFQAFANLSVTGKLDQETLEMMGRPRCGVKNFVGQYSYIFWSGFRSNGAKMLIFGPKCQFWAKFGRFWAQNPIFGGRE